MRFTKAQRDAVKAALLRGKEAADLDVLVENVCHAFATAEDDKTRYVVVTSKGNGERYAYGPYATVKTAAKALDSGDMIGEVAVILGMRPVPRAVKRG